MMETGIETQYMIIRTVAYSTNVRGAWHLFKIGGISKDKWRNGKNKLTEQNKDSQNKEVSQYVNNKWR